MERNEELVYSNAQSVWMETFYYHLHNSYAMDAALGNAKQAYDEFIKNTLGNNS